MSATITRQQMKSLEEVSIAILGYFMRVPHQKLGLEEKYFMAMLKRFVLTRFGAMTASDLNIFVTYLIESEIIFRSSILSWIMLGRAVRAPQISTLVKKYEGWVIANTPLNLIMENLR